MSWFLLALVRLYRRAAVARVSRAGRAVLPVRADLLGLRRGGDPHARRPARAVAGGAPAGCAAIRSRAAGLRSRCRNAAARARSRSRMEKRVIVAIVAVRRRPHSLDAAVSRRRSRRRRRPRRPPPATAPAAPAAPAPAPAAGSAAPAPARPAAPVVEPARAPGRAVDARGPLRVLQPGRDAGARAAARDAVPRRHRRSERAATTSCARWTARTRRCARRSPTPGSRRPPTAPGRRASRRRTRSCSRPTAATSTSRSATAPTQARYRLHLDVVVTNRGDAPVEQQPGAGGDRPAGPGQARRRVLLGRVGQHRRRWSATSTASVERKAIEKLAQEPIRTNGRGAVSWIATDEKFFLLAAVPYPETPRAATAPARWRSTGTDVGQVTLSLRGADRARRTARSPTRSSSSRARRSSTTSRRCVRPGGAGRAGRVRRPRSTSTKAVDVTLAFLSRPILSLLKFFHRFAHNWGLAIVLLTLFIKLLTFYPTQKSLLSAQEDAEAGAQDGRHPQEVRERPAAAVGRDDEPLQGARRVAVRRLPAQPDPDADLDRAVLDAELRRRAVPRAVRRRTSTT